MRTRRWDCSAVAVGHCLYVIGGLQSQGFLLNVVEEFDPEKNAWTQLPPMPMGRVGCAAAALRL